jgi:GH35 family endo-1,4-beta-xylanase
MRVRVLAAVDRAALADDDAHRQKVRGHTLVRHHQNPAYAALRDTPAPAGR